MEPQWGARAADAEAAIVRRHLRRLWQLPGTQLGVVGWPPTARDRAFGSWHYWWQAHLLDTLIDAQLRDPRPERLIHIRRQVRGHHARNLGRWTNSYYDDMAWLALALERAARLAGVRRPRALASLCSQLVGSWMPESGGGIPWRKQDRFFNAPANGPAGIFLARYGEHLPRAQAMADWLDDTLIDPETHLVFDGIRDGSLVRAQYTYCQGVVVGLETELAVRTGEPRHVRRAGRLVAAIAEHMAPGECCAAGAAETAACSPGSPPAIWPWRPIDCPGIATHERRPGRSCSPRRRRRGTTGAASTVCRCSAPSGTGRPSCRPPAGGPRGSPAVRFTPPRSPNAICPCRFRAGC